MAFDHRPRRPLHCAPRRRRLRRPGRCDRLVTAVAAVEDGNPLVGAVVAEADLEARALHAGDHQAEPGPGVQPAVQ